MKTYGKHSPHKNLIIVMFFKLNLSFNFTYARCAKQWVRGL